jgi:hypothetical protein
VSCIEQHPDLRLAIAVLGLAWMAGCSNPLPSMAPPPAPRAGATAAPATTPSTVRTWEQYRMQAARRIVAANPQQAHMGAVEEPLLAIPVLEVELNGDGSVRNVNVLREPRQAKDTTRIAIDAVRRAGPFGDVTRLPKPWRFSEAFLFNDDRRFKPRSLD